MSNDIMIDLETLATTADAVILSIGAVCFDLEGGTVNTDPAQRFYRTVCIGEQGNRQISEATLQWWMAQSEQARSVFFCPVKVSLRRALVDLSEWTQGRHVLKPKFWSNGADFDLPILDHAYMTMSMCTPWEPYAGRCYRTYKNLPGARAIKVERKGNHHNALDDAIYQAQHLCAIHAALFGSVPATDKKQGGAA